MSGPAVHWHVKCISDVNRNSFRKST